MITTIIFDWAGVLTTGRYTQAILDEFNNKKIISIEEIYDDFDALVLEMMKGNLPFHEFVSKINNDFDFATDATEMRDVFNRAIHPNNSTIDFAKTLKSNYKLVMLSNNDATTVGNIKNHHSNMFDIFEKKYFSFELGLIKPDPRIYQHVIEDLGVKASECLFIDDKLKNVDGAKQVGMNAIQFINIEQLKAALIS